MRSLAPMPTVTYLSVSQASRRHDIPKRTLQAAIARGDLPAAKLPGATTPYLIDPDDLHTWLAGRIA